MTTTYPVIQKDREAAARVILSGRLSLKEMVAAEFRAGHGDDHPMVQEFARHRIETPVPDTDLTAVMVCPNCDGEGSYADGLDEAACTTHCVKCAGNGWVVDITRLFDISTIVPFGVGTAAIDSEGRVSKLTPAAIQPQAHPTGRWHPSHAEHWSIEQLKRIIIIAMTQCADGKGMSVTARHAADRILELLRPHEQHRPLPSSPCTCETSLEMDARDPGGPSSGQPAPPPCEAHPNATAPTTVAARRNHNKLHGHER